MGWLGLFGRPVCASCAGPVDQGRCPTCRRARAEGYGGPPIVAVVVALIVAILVMVLTVLAGAARAAAVVPA